jgi:hypothetical protein
LAAVVFPVGKEYCKTHPHMWMPLYDQGADPVHYQCISCGVLATEFPEELPEELPEPNVVIDPKPF